VVTNIAIVTGVFETMVYNYTKPRRPVAAEYSGPGPTYGMPSLIGQTRHDPRSIHPRGPAYHFGLRHDDSKSANASPGPIYMPEPKYYRNGKEQTPAYPIVGRRKELENGELPGPLSYDTTSKKTDLMSNHSRPPAYTFGLKRNEKDFDRSPGPAKYVLPSGKVHVESTKRRSPSYPIVGRSTVGGFHEDLSNTPGPQKYNPIEVSKYMARSPAYSITGRNTMPEDATQKPGPMSHQTETVWVHKREPPKYSFGIRHSPYAGTYMATVED